MRDRLIELTKASLIRHIDKSCNLAENIADDLLADGVVVPPCKAGDTVYVLTFDAPTGIEKSRAKRLQIIERDDGTTVKIIVPCVFDDWGDAFRVFFPEDFGKTVFLTREQAEKALAEATNEQH